jgi:MFS family permease
MHSNRNKLFIASCVALVTTSMVFSIRVDINDALGADLRLNKEQLGYLMQPAFWGFTASILVGGSLVDLFGMRRLLYVSSFGYIVSVLAMVFGPTPSAPVTSMLSEPGIIIAWVAMLMLGLAQGLVEGVINPLCTTLYPDNKTHRMNVLHAWWPGGLIIGGLLAYAVTKIMGLDGADVSVAAASLGWRIKLSLILFSAVLYAFLIRGQAFPATERVTAGVSTSRMLKEALRPMFLLFWICMWMTAITELGTDTWVGSLITNLTGMEGILILVYTSGIMFVLRFYGGPVASRFSPMGVLTVSAVLSGIGLYALSYVETPLQAFAAATIFGVGKTYFWPFMLGITSERFPNGGAFLLAIMGGTGNLAVAFVLPVMGGWYDAEGAAAAFRYVTGFPVILTVIFVSLYFYFKSIGGYRAVEVSTDS